MPVYIIFGAHPASYWTTIVFVAASLKKTYVPFKVGRFTGELAEKTRYDILIESRCNLDVDIYLELRRVTG